MNRNLIALALIIVSIVIISILTYLRKISLDVGIIISVLLVIIYPLILTFLPSLIDYSLKPKVTLQISNLKFIKKNFNGIEGYQLKALVTNKGKKIGLNICASFMIKNAQGESPNLLHLRFDTRNGQETVEHSEEPMRDTRYAWNKEGERTYLGNWTELRQNDYVSLLFPYETFSGRMGITTFRSEILLKLVPNFRYKVVVEVKGEDSEKNTAIGNKKQTLTS